MLIQPSKRSAIIAPRAGTEVEVREGCAFIIARCGDCVLADEAFDAAHDIAQEGLDILTAAGHRPTQLTDAYSEVMLWVPPIPEDRVGDHHREQHDDSNRGYQD